MSEQNRNSVSKQVFHIVSSPLWIGLMIVLPLFATSHFAMAVTTAKDTVEAGKAKVSKAQVATKAKKAKVAKARVAKAKAAKARFSSANSSKTKASKPKIKNVSFDHMQTGFILTGTHSKVRCETCHIQGMFKGTPRDCAGCHMAGNRFGALAKPSRHVPTFAPCDSCHRTSGWSPASYSHAGVAPGTCMTCHNGTMVSGKPGGHVLTTASCDSCHRSTAWIPAGFNHMGVAPGTCASCHGVTATGIPSGHVATNGASCDTCHSTRAWLPAGFNHVGVIPGSCASCHNGTKAMGKPSNHIPEAQLLNGATLGCDGCHTSTRVFTTIRMNHNNSQGNGSGWCEACHASGTNYLGNMEKKSLTHDSTGKTDCSESGCHRPLGNQGSTYSSW